MLYTCVLSSVGKALSNTASLMESSSNDVVALSCSSHNISNLSMASSMSWYFVKSNPKMLCKVAKALPGASSLMRFSILRIAS